VDEQTLKRETGDKMREKETLDERLPGLFEPDTLLPIQYFEAMRKKHLLEGEKRLVLSVLEDAVECFMKCIEATTHKGQRLFREAEEWVTLEDKRWVFSFDNVCEMLDINPEYMRAGLKRWKERRLELIQLRHEALAREAEEAAKAQATPAAPMQKQETVVERKPVAAPAAAKPARARRHKPARIVKGRRRTAAKLRKARA
jgi:hypothetical protein